MILEQIPIGNMDNFAYIIGDSETKEAALVDPAWDADALLRVAEKKGLNISKILITHTDFDHINAVGDAFEKTKAKVYVHRLGEHDIRSYGVDNIELIDEGSEIQIGTLQVNVMYTPGHKPTNVCFMVGKKLLTGDTLFVEGCGRVDMPGGDIRKQWDSLQRLKELEDDIEVYPGHDYGSMKVSTIKHEKEHNPYLLCTSYEEFAGVR